MDPIQFSNCNAPETPAAVDGRWKHGHWGCLRENLGAKRTIGAMTIIRPQWLGSVPSDRVAAAAVLLREEPDEEEDEGEDKGDGDEDDDADGEDDEGYSE